MNKLFEFGQYWDTGTFFMFFSIGCIVALLSKKGSQRKYSFRLDDEKKKNIRFLTVKINIYYILLFLVLFFVYSFRREDVGADTPEYVLLFRNAKSLHFEMNSIFPTINLYEPLFMLTTYMIRCITDNYTIYFIVVGFVIAYSYTKFIKVFWPSESSHIFLIAFVACFFYDLNVMRAAIGTAYILLSMCALKEGKEKKAFLLSIVGIMFHYTVLVNIPLLILFYIVKNKKRINRKKLFFLIVTGSAVLFILIPFSKTYLGSSKYQVYLGMESTINILGLWEILLAIGTSLFFLTWYKYRSKAEDILVVSGLYNIILIFLITQMGMYRVGSYYGMTRLALWDTVEKKFSNNSKIVLNVLFFILMIFMLLFKMSRYSDSPGFTYYTIWTI